MSSTSRIMTKNRQLFTGAALSEAYHHFRPTYPPAVFEAILDFLAAGHKRSSVSSQLSKQHSLAVDMGCGTGLATRPLAQHFDKVIGCDVSESQIEVAIRNTQLANIEFLVAPCEDMSLVKDGSVDLVTCAKAFHWMDNDATYVEVNRILRPGGVLAIYTSGRPELNTKEAQDALIELVHDRLKQYDSPSLGTLRNHYRDLILPFADITRNDNLHVESDVTLSSLIGHLESFSSYQALLRAHPESTALQELSDKLKSILASEAAASDDSIVHVSYPVFIVMGRKK